MAAGQPGTDFGRGVLAAPQALLLIEVEEDALGAVGRHVDGLVVHAAVTVDETQAYPAALIDPRGPVLWLIEQSAAPADVA